MARVGCFSFGTVGTAEGQISSSFARASRELIRVMYRVRSLVQLW